MSKVNSHNEWDQLKEVIVGIADNARFPKNDMGMNVNIAFDEEKLPDMTVEIPRIPQSVIDETNEDLDILVDELKKLDVTVRRPSSIDTQLVVKTPYWETSQYFNYCPRDTMLVVGDTIIESPNIYRSRYFENFSYRDLFTQYLQSGSKWISVPKPRLREEDYIIHSGTATVLNETDPMFDAANILRAGKDIFYLVSNSGNELGLQWLQNTLGKDYTVHPLRNIYSGTHIDTTIAFLRPGLALVNPERVQIDKLPESLKKWEIIAAPEMVEYNYSGIQPLSSKWLGMNLFSISPTLAVVDAHQKELIKLLEKHRIDVLPLNLRHGRLLEGGFHCVTVDINRQGKKEDYFS